MAQKPILQIYGHTFKSLASHKFWKWAWQPCTWWHQCCKQFLAIPQLDKHCSQKDVWVPFQEANTCRSCVSTTATPGCKHCNQNLCVFVKSMIISKQICNKRVQALMSTMVKVVNTINWCCMTPTPKEQYHQHYNQMCMWPRLQYQQQRKGWVGRERLKGERKRWGEK